MQLTLHTQSQMEYPTSRDGHARNGVRFDCVMIRSYVVGGWSGEMGDSKLVDGVFIWFCGGCFEFSTGGEIFMLREIRWKNIWFYWILSTVSKILFTWFQNNVVQGRRIDFF